VELSVLMYQLTNHFPREEAYALSSQIRRAAVSVASNIAEGAARRTDKDFIHFLHIALGSASELDTQLEIASRIGFLDHKETEETQSSIGEISKMIYGLIRSVEQKHHE